MGFIAIYYKMNDEQNSEEVIKEISETINKINKNVLGVYIDLPEQFDEFSNLISSDLSVISTLYLNKELEHGFDRKIINELARSESFFIEYFSK